MTIDLSYLEELIQGFADAKILCVGDVMLDRFVYGSVSRISPEAPIPVLRVQREATSLGGVGNVAVNVRTLGARPSLIATIGEDDAGDDIAIKLAATVTNPEDILKVSDRPTTQKIRYLARNQQLLRADTESTVALGSEDRRQLLAMVDKALPGSGAVILSDYGKGTVDNDLATAVIERARAAEIPVIVDPMVRDFAKYRGAHVVSPNRNELADATGMATGTDDEIEAACWHLIDTCGIEAVVATRSEQGLSIVSANGGVCHIPTQAREIWDVSGAGDTVVACLAVALAAGRDASESPADSDARLLDDRHLIHAGHLANIAGGVVVGKVGTASLTAGELAAQVLRDRNPSTSGTKIADLESALDRITKWRRQGARIGFTNGCFDILHTGHVSLIAQARAQCDRLILGLNSDDSVSRLKGAERPINGVADRSALLAALADVDLVVVFGEDTPMRLIEAIRPDVLIKGADYTVETVVGADLVQSYGGRVFLAALTPERSTTRTIAKLSGQTDQAAE